MREETRVISTARFSLPILFVFLALIALSGATPAQAQQRYRQWGNPDGAAAAGKSRTQDFVDRLKRMIIDAEKSRAADPRFLRDLRDLARGFDRPWRRRLFSDDFLDGDFTANPAWTVTAGRYWVEKGWGLRSAIEPGQAAAPSGDTGGKRLRGKDAAIAILGAVLNQATGNRGGEPAPARSAAPAVAAIQAPARITNAFAIEFELSSWRDNGNGRDRRDRRQTGKLEIGPYQGNAGGAGYRLAYRPGGNFELLRVSPRGTGIIDAAAAAALEDKKPHAIEWTRRADGVMTVTLDGKQILSATDRGIRQGFDGIAITNRGGDYIVKRITVYGVN